MTQELLRKHLNYNAVTGLMTWAAPLTIYSRINIDEPAGHTNKAGRVVLTFAGSVTYVSRAIWIYMYGSIPEGYQIDHINRIRNDNRLSNLRCVTNRVNANNKTKYNNNTSGVTGVYKSKNGTKWMASIKVEGKNKHLGTYNTFNEAAEVRRVAKLNMEFKG